MRMKISLEALLAWIIWFKLKNLSPECDLLTSSRALLPATTSTGKTACKCTSGGKSEPMNTLLGGYWLTEQTMMWSAWENKFSDIFLYITNWNILAESLKIFIQIIYDVDQTVIILLWIIGRARKSVIRFSKQSSKLENKSWRTSKLSRNIWVSKPRQMPKKQQKISSSNADLRANIPPSTMMRMKISYHVSFKRMNTCLDL